MMNARRFIALVMLLFACPAFALGNEICFAPTLDVKEEYNSNILLVPGSDPNNLKKDYITTLSPGFELIDKTDRIDFVLSLRLDRLQYARNHDLSASDPQYGFSVGQSATQRLKFSAKAGYDKNSNLSLNTGPAPRGLQPGDIIIPKQPAEPQPPTEPQPQPQQPPLPTTPVVPKPALPLVATAAERISSSASVGFQFTEMTSVNGQYQYSAGSYEKPRYRDASHGVQAGLETDLGMYIPRVKGRLSAGYTQYRVTEPESKTVSVSGTVGFSYGLNETWNVIVDGGLRRTKSETFVTVPEPLGNETPPVFIGVRERFDNTSWGRVGHLALNYHDQYLGVELGYTRDLTLASGLQAAAEQNTLSLSTSYRLTHELSAALTAAYGTFRSDPSNTATVIRQNSMSISPLLRYEFYRRSGEKRDLAIEAGYEHTLVDYLALDTRADREVYFIRLSTRFPFCSSSQYK